MNKSIKIYSLQSIEMNKTYEYKFESGETKKIVIRGGNNENGLIISVNGIENSYTDLDGALGEPYLSFSKLD